MLAKCIAMQAKPALVSICKELKHAYKYSSSPKSDHDHSCRCIVIVTVAHSWHLCMRAGSIASFYPSQGSGISS